MHERGTRGVREGQERGTRGALVGTKVETVFFILTDLGHRRCTKGAREGHKRKTRGAREGHEMCIAKPSYDRSI